MTEVAQSEKPVTPDTQIEGENPAQHFEAAYNKEVDVSNTAEADANKTARDALFSKAEAKSLRDAGIRKVVYGLALSPLTFAGSLMGRAVGGRAGELIANRMNKDVELATLAGGGIGSLAGTYGGVEFGALAYEHIVRRWDTQARGLDKKDWIFGQLIGSPVIVSGVRDIWKGHEALKGMS